ncbi:MAG: CocE/NonD family hydrolase [Acidobacteria bacterium]|nr:CocE/NonD family hydrolase [Acidobacteriota bacterium]
MIHTLLLAFAVPFPEAYPPTNDVVMDNLVAAPMRDGVKLYADVYRPAAPGKYPVIVSRTPYSTERYPNSYDAAVFFAQRGFVYVYQDVRGRHESDGKWEPFRNDIEDGYDTIEWAAAQPWSTGKVGMQGGSYLGHVQWRAAMSRPPHLTAIFPGVAATSLYHDWITLNGGWRLSFNFGWGPVRQESRIMQNTGMHGGVNPESLQYDKMQRHLPLNDMQRLAGRNAQFYKDWIAHPDYDAYWKKLNAEEVMDEINVPAHTFGGWFDIFSQGTLRGYALLSKKGATEAARKQSRLIIGPWGHGSSQKFGDLDFGPHAHVNQQAVELRYFDYHLKGLANGLDREPPVNIYVMGRNEWVAENEYPLARTQYRDMYLHAGGKLSWTAPAGEAAPTQYRYDPDNPVPSLGGNNCCGTPTPAGPKDQGPLDSRGDILRYTSEFLSEPVEVTGPVKLVLHAATDAPDTDFVAKLIDVYPDGRALNMAEGIVRARYREGTDKPKLLDKGKVYEFTVDMVGTSVEFLKGHRIRVDIASSHFPQFDRNPNTGEPFGASAAVRVAQQTVHQSKMYPSHLVLPVIPARK